MAAESLNGLAWKIHINSTLAQGLVNIGGFFVMGGWAWIRHQRGAKVDIDELAPKPEPFNRHQIFPLSAVGLLILLIVVPGLPSKVAGSALLKELTSARSAANGCRGRLPPTDHPVTSFQ